VSILQVARAEIRALKPYLPARQEAHAIRLNANESATANGGLHRYPEIRPAGIQAQLASHFAVAPGNLLATRGSSEAIDLLLRAFCRAGIDNIVISSPTFEMYRVYANIQGAETIAVSLSPDDDFALDPQRFLDACTPESKLIFVCSPNNPAGTPVAAAAIEKLLEARRDQSVVVVDEAYIEFSNEVSRVEWLHRFDNLVVLRTMSKAQGLAGARCGAVIGSEQLISMLDGVLSPYAMSTPVIECVLDALSGQRLQQSAASVADTVAERNRMAAALEGLDLVERCWPSAANFLLVRFGDIEKARVRLRAARILIREFAEDLTLEHCARITVGTPAENNALLEALA